jgi:hypothetical protein
MSAITLGYQGAQNTMSEKSQVISGPVGANTIARIEDMAIRMEIPLRTLRGYVRAGMEAKEEGGIVYVKAGDVYNWMKPATTTRRK